MRLFIINLLATALVLTSAGLASAYQIRVEGPANSNLNPGDTIFFDVFLDTQGESNIVLLGIDLQVDNTVVAYDPAQSTIAASALDLFIPPANFTGLLPTNDPPTLFNPAPNLDRVLIDFAASGFTPTTVVADNVFLASIAFTATGAGGTTLLASFFPGDTGTFEIGDPNGGTINISGDVPIGGTGNGASITVVPEPTTALLVGLGLVGLGVAGRRQA